MKTNSSNTGNASADMKLDVQHSGIRATVGNRRKSIDVIRFRAQPDEEQNRVYGDGDEFNPDRTRMFARMKRETMRCKHCSDEMNERRRKMRLEQDGPTMNYVCKRNDEIANRIDKDSQNLKNGQVSVPSSSHVRAEDDYDEGRRILDDEEDEDSYVFVGDMQDDVPMTGTVHEDKNIKKRTVRAKEDESGMKDKQKRNAGYKIMSTNDRWAVVENDMGYEYDIGELMRTLYAMYLDILIYYYKFRAVQGKAIDKEMVEQDKGSSDLCHEEGKGAEIFKMKRRSITMLCSPVMTGKG
ncbi:hypothetical protein HanXRQr2_Chr08g0337891 [Helianthus annuus]|uniref:Uncharacterized protein n=1 Tax=Helianthus annuus TaxID=4232 RepID=A0A9K3NCK8_HELAN|nr:hypothetical protein HanXRQr2_Chr08g0337891 [Helianthus annuus]